MTNQGYDYLGVIRSNSVWDKTKKGAAEIGGTSLGILRDIEVAYVKQAAAEELGIKL